MLERFCLLRGRYKIVSGVNSLSMIVHVKLGRLLPLIPSSSSLDHVAHAVGYKEIKRKMQGGILA